MLPLTFSGVIAFFLPMAYNYCVAIFVYNRFHSFRRDEVTVSYLWKYGSACSILLDTVIYRSSALFLFALWIQKSVLAIKIAYAHPLRQILPFFFAEKFLFGEKFFFSWYHFKAFVFSFKTTAIPSLRKHHFDRKHCLFMKYFLYCHGLLNHHENSREAEFECCCGTDDLCPYASFSTALWSDLDRHKVFYIQYDCRSWQGDCISLIFR